MGERAAPPSTVDAVVRIVPFDSPAASPNPKLGTYVVQVQKDQIYRVPPPENAALVERYRNKNKIRRRRSPCLGCLKWILGAAFLVLALLAAAAIAFYFAVRPTTPSFAVQLLSVKNSENAVKGSTSSRPRPKPEYNFAMSIDNPSGQMGYVYEAGGKAVLTDGSVEIAAGATPRLKQGAGKPTVVRLALRGSNVLLPKGIESSLKGASKEAVSLELSVKFTVRPMAARMELWALSMDVSCDVRVSGMGAKQARILSQKCKTSLELRF